MRASLASVSLERRFWQAVSPCPNTGCWFWTGAAWKNYGVIYGEGRHRVATHVSLRLHGRPPPTEQAFACHHCDVRFCVNPDHLYWGDAGTNIQDSYDRKRRVSPLFGRVGERGTNAKLTEADVEEILTSALSSPKLAEIYGAAHSTIRRIIRRERWSHVQTVSPGLSSLD